MQRMRLDHVGLVVSKLDKGRKHLAAGLSIDTWTRETVDEVNGVRLQFGRDPAGLVYELLEPLGETSPLYAALKTGKGILNHVAYRVESLDDGHAHLSRAGWARTSDPKPAIAYGGRRIQFFVSPVKLIVELIEAWDHEHIYEPHPTHDMATPPSA